MSEPAEPGILDRLRARYGWFDHAVRAYTRFSERRGGFYAAGLTYYTIFALFPLLMVGFAVVGFTLSRNDRLLNMTYDRIRALVPGAFGQQLIDLVNSAIDARASVGVIGLATAAWAGLGWMSHLRVALSEMWAHPVELGNYVRNKLSDLAAMVGTFVVTMATIALTALGYLRPMAAALKWLGIPELSVLDWAFRAVSVVLSVVVSWLLFTWMIARLPRQSGRFVTSMRAGLIAAVGFELFKQVGSIYLRTVLRSPAGATFGPVLGLMVFAYVTAYLVLFSTAWAATDSAEDPRAKHVDPPGPAIIRPRIQVNEGLAARQALAAVVTGAVGALTFSRLLRRRTRGVD
ncbi:MAG: inner membrane protein YhjD [Mycobacterium pseudokansasii]|uniref:Inner membrane protein YhjD n=1 Tax=Mycobacterium pseudokansasii TaxID=2341080 RepID=A0A498QLV0_9MYCO|nr:inner membrane protein YhjD [Mycobacterium pseudokansasii]MBY0388636.1 inner membrane protein YhjD [Mycobacterium pseudokansasii]VBA48179.1 Inner membrane protein YhjD [Mycobacterium pseudokansasii]